MRKIAAIAVLAVAIATGGLLLPSASGAADVGVTVGDMSFSAATTTVAVGDTVTWTVDSDLVHTVTADGGSFASGNLTGGNTFSHTFTEPGTYAYHCQFHGAAGGIGMSGTVVVEGAEGPTTTGAPSSSTSEVPGPTTTAPSAGGTVTAPQFTG